MKTETAALIVSAVSLPVAGLSLGWQVGVGKPTRDGSSIPTASGWRSSKALRFVGSSRRADDTSAAHWQVVVPRGLAEWRCLRAGW